MLCDFGMMRLHHDIHLNSMSTNPHISLNENFAAPELFDEFTGREMRPEEPSDIFAFAKTILAFSESKEPRPGPIERRPTSGINAAFGNDADDIWKLMLAMTNADPKARPTMNPSTLDKGLQVRLMEIIARC